MYPLKGLFKLVSIGTLRIALFTDLFCVLYFCDVGRVFRLCFGCAILVNLLFISRQ